MREYKKQVDPGEQRQASHRSAAFLVKRIASLANMTAKPHTDSELMLRTWMDMFRRPVDPQSAAEHALFEHLMKSAGVYRLESQDSRKPGIDGHILELLRADADEKWQYLDPSWGYFEAAAIVSRVDECAISLQERKKKEFLDPLSWDFAPHSAVIATVKAVLLLFDMKYPSHLLDDELWRNYWGLWIVKNIDAHIGGWEWAATNEPMGLFTKPYALSASFLPQVRRLLDATRSAPAEHRCWHHMAAYACLRDWAEACVAYVHMKTHCLPGFPAHAEVDKLVAPPRRTPQANVWFRLATPEGIDYFYNRVLQEIVLDKPDDFDGGNVTSIPNAVRELVEDALRNDHAKRLELERRGHRRARDALLEEEQWLECIDYRTQQPYYYSLRYCRMSAVPPPSGVFLKHTESVAYQAVLRLQTAYRKRRLAIKLQVKRTKRASLPVFSLATTKKFY